MVDAFERAAERAEKESRQRQSERWTHAHRQGFRIHATVFVAVQILILAAWILQWQQGGTTYPWFIYPLLGWGVGLAAHYVAVRDNFKNKQPNP